MPEISIISPKTPCTVDFQDPIDHLQAGHGQRWGDADREGSFDEEAHEMDDFIEHDGETTDAQYKAHRRALAKSARAQGISMDAAQELLEIFGQDAETRQRLEEWELANEIENWDVVGLETEVPFFFMYQFATATSPQLSQALRRWLVHRNAMR